MKIDKVFNEIEGYCGFIHVSGELSTRDNRLSAVIKSPHIAYEVTELPKGYRIVLWGISGGGIKRLGEEKVDNKKGLKAFKTTIKDRHAAKWDNCVVMNERDFDFSYENKPWGK
jgi:hypothetical protein